MFKLLEDDLNNFVYQAEFSNPITIIYENNTIILSKNCMISMQVEGIIDDKGCYDELTIKLHTNATIFHGIINGKNTKLNTYQSKQIPYFKQIQLLRQTAKRLNKAIEETYLPGGIMYKQAETTIDRLN